MRPWVNNEDGPTCDCGEPTLVKTTEDRAILLCFFHTSETGCYVSLPPMAPDNWADLSYEEVLVL